jgi:hypothetical protein
MGRGEREARIDETSPFSRACGAGAYIESGADAKRGVCFGI